MSFKNTKVQLSEYISDIFFETGTYLGETSKIACEIGFKKVITTELFEEQQKKAIIECKDYNIDFQLGKSTDVMRKYLPNLEGKITFWLDAHISAHQNPFGVDECPVIEELSIIKTLKRNDHIIMIDDIKIIGQHGWGIKTTLENIILSVKSINPNYDIYFIDGQHVDNDILVAIIK